MVTVVKKNIWARFETVSKLFFVSKFIFCLQIHFLDLNLIDFSSVAYYRRQSSYLADPGGFSYQQKYLGPIWSCLQIHFLSPNYFLSPNTLSGRELIRFF